MGPYKRIIIVGLLAFLIMEIACTNNNNDKSGSSGSSESESKEEDMKGNKESSGSDGSDNKSSGSKEGGSKSSESKEGGSKSSESKEGGSKSSESKEGGSKSSESKEGGSKSSESKEGGSKSSDSKSSKSKESGSKSSESKGSDGKSSGSKSSDGKSSGSKSSDDKSSDSDEESKGTCWIQGDPHLTTLDGYEGNVHGEVPCDYYFVQHKDFSIIGLLVDCFRTNISCIKKIQINYQADTWFLHQGKAVPNRATDKVGKPINLPFESNGIKMERSGNYVVVSLPNGVIVLWNGIRNAEIQVPIAFMKKVQGMCGNYDGNASNDSEASTKTYKYKVDASCQSK